MTVETAELEELARTIIREAPIPDVQGAGSLEERKTLDGCHVILRVFATPGTWEAQQAEVIFRFGLTAAQLRRAGIATVSGSELEIWISASGRGINDVKTMIREARYTSGHHPLVDLPPRLLWVHLARSLRASWDGSPLPRVPHGYCIPQEPARSLLSALLTRDVTGGRIKLPGWMKVISDGMPRAVGTEEDCYDPQLQIAATNAYVTLREGGRGPDADDLRSALSVYITRQLARSVC